MPSSDPELTRQLIKGRSGGGQRLTLSGCVDIDVGEHFPGRDGDDCGLGRDLIDISWPEAAGTSQRTRYLLV